MFGKLTGAPIRDKYRLRISKSELGCNTLELLLLADSNFSLSKTSAALKNFFGENYFFNKHKNTYSRFCCRLSLAAGVIFKAPLRIAFKIQSIITAMNATKNY